MALPQSEAVASWWACPACGTPILDGEKRCRCPQPETPTLTYVGAARRAIDEASNEAAIAGFATYQRRRNFSEKTVSCRESVLRMLHQAAGAGGALGATRAEVETFLDSLPLGPQGRYTYTSHLHAFFKFAVREGLALRDPTLGIDRPRLPKRLPRPLAPADLARAMGAAGPQMKAWLCLGAYQGFRISDMAGLRREDVLDASEPARILVSQGKGKKDRLLPAHPRTLEALHSYGMPSTGRIFVRSNGAAMTAGDVGHRIGKLFSQLGINATPHALRHTFGSTVYARSRDIMLTKHLMGHESIQTSMGYVALNPDQREVDVVQGLGQ